MAEIVSRERAISACHISENRNFIEPERGVLMGLFLGPLETRLSTRAEGAVGQPQGLHIGPAAFGRGEALRSGRNHFCKRASHMDPFTWLMWRLRSKAAADADADSVPEGAATLSVQGMQLRWRGACAPIFDVLSNSDYFQRNCRY